MITNDECSTRMKYTGDNDDGVIESITDNWDKNLFIFYLFLVLMDVTEWTNKTKDLIPFRGWLTYRCYVSNFRLKVISWKCYVSSFKSLGWSSTTPLSTIFRDWSWNTHWMYNMHWIFYVSKEVKFFVNSNSLESNI